MAVVDGYTGTFYIDPDEDILKKMQEKKEEDIKARELLQELKGKEDITVDGKHIRMKKHSSRHTRRLQRTWQERK